MADSPQDALRDKYIDDCINGLLDIASPNDIIYWVMKRAREKQETVIKAQFLVDKRTLQFY